MTLREYIDYLQEYEKIANLDETEVQFISDGKLANIDLINTYMNDDNILTISIWSQETTEADNGMDEYFEELCKSLDTDSEILDSAYINKQVGRI